MQPAWQSRGIGTRLDEHLEQVARARGLRALRCVVVKLNPRSRAWHERLGYRCIGESIVRWLDSGGREVERDCWEFERRFSPPDAPGG